MRYAIDLASLNGLQQKIHPVYWLIKPILTDVVEPVGGRFVDTAVVLNTEGDRWPAIAAVLVDADIAGRGYLWNSIKFYYSTKDGARWYRLTPQDLMDIGAPAWEAIKKGE